MVKPSIYTKRRLRLPESNLEAGADEGLIWTDGKYQLEFLAAYSLGKGNDQFFSCVVMLCTHISYIKKIALGYTENRKVFSNSFNFTREFSCQSRNKMTASPRSGHSSMYVLEAARLSFQPVIQFSNGIKHTLCTPVCYVYVCIVWTWFCSAMETG